MRLACADDRTTRYADRATEKTRSLLNVQKKQNNRTKLAEGTD